jgi:hypothetical protein
MVRPPAQENPLTLRRLQERLGDQLLTILTIMLGLWLFVVEPLRADALIGSEIIGFVLALAVTTILLVLSNSSKVAALMLLAIGLSVTAGLLRFRHSSALDVYLNAGAWLLVGLVLIWVVGKAVFAPGRITYHRIMGAILLYLAIGLTFVSLFTFLGLLVPDSLAGLSVKDSPTFTSTMIYFVFGTLTGAGSGDIAPAHPMARSLTVVVAMIGQLYPATLLARLVTLEIEGETTRG